MRVNVGQFFVLDAVIILVMEAAAKMENVLFVLHVMN
jgi:hypothetical protein